MTNPTPPPLEDVFDIRPGSTEGGFKFDDTEPGSPLNERASALIDPTTGDIIERSSEPTQNELEKEERLEDLHIDSQLENVHSAAMIAFEQQARMAQEVDPKFSARNAEVAAQYLNIALNAVNSRVDAKYKRQKIKVAKKEATKPGTVNNNVFIADRNELLRQMLGKDEALPIIEEVKRDS
jgi:hypothetical protein